MTWGALGTHGWLCKALHCATHGELQQALAAHYSASFGGAARVERGQLLLLPAGIDQAVPISSRALPVWQQQQDGGSRSSGPLLFCWSTLRLAK
jgi:hypothetical protein